MLRSPHHPDFHKAPSAEGAVMRPAHDRGYSSPPHVRGGSVSRRGLNQVYRRPPPPLRRNPLCRSTQPKRQPLFGREREEGKDSHSRQWRLSMAVFLNRNKRPLAAPIEVAELLSEKPPPSQPPYHPHVSSGGGPGEGASLSEKRPPPEYLVPQLPYLRVCAGATV